MPAADVPPEARPLRADVIRACLGLIGGLLAGLALEAATAHYDSLTGSVAQYLGPFVVAALFLRIGAKTTLSIAGRFVGAYVGWLGMWFVTNALFGSSYQYGGPVLTLTMLAVMFAAFVPAGVILGDRIQSGFLAPSA